MEDLKVTATGYDFAPARAAMQRLQAPATFDVESFMKGKVLMLGLALDVVVRAPIDPAQAYGVFRM